MDANAPHRGISHSDGTGAGTGTGRCQPMHRRAAGSKGWAPLLLQLLVSLLISVLPRAGQASAETVLLVNNMVDSFTGSCQPIESDSSGATCNLRAAISYCLTNAGGGGVEICELQLAAGTYTMTQGQLNATVDTATDVRMLILGKGPGRTIVDGGGNNNERWMEISGQTNGIRIAHISVQSFFMNGGDGGAVLIDGTVNSGIVFEDVRFDSCVASGDGGAVAIYTYNNNVSFSNITLADCVATEGMGGGVSIYRYNTNTRFADTQWINCTAYSDDGGGVGVDQQNTGLSFERCLWEENTSPVDGGGVAFGDDNEDASFIDCSWYRNYADDDGAGIYLNQDNNNASFENCTWQKNSAGDKGTSLYLFAENRYVSVTNGLFEDNRANSKGAAVYLHRYNDHLLLANVVLRRNWAAEEGGALYFHNINYNTTLIDCLWERNSADELGGAVFSDNYNHGSVFRRNVWRGNTAGDNGGAAYFDQDNHDASFEDCTFESNSATAGDGGGLYMKDFNHGVQFRGCTWTANTAPESGGGVYFNWDTSQVVFENCSFSNNSAQQGAGLYMDQYNDDAIFDNCHWENNTASNYGGGVYMEAYNNDVQFRACEWLSNTAAGSGGGVYFAQYNDRTNFSMSRFVRNTALNGGGITLFQDNEVYFHRSTFEANSATDGGGVYLGSENTGTLFTYTKWSRNTAERGAGAFLDTSNSDVTFVRCTWLRNAATTGGGVYSNQDNPGLHLVRSDGERNVAVAAGAVLYLRADNTATKIDHCTFSENAAGGRGGVVTSVLSTTSAVVKDSAFTSNTASYGGALALGQDDEWAITSSTFEDNRASVQGGAIFCTDTMTAVVNMTRMVANSAALGGALYAESTTLADIVDTVLDRNRATTSGAGMYVENTEVHVRNGSVERNRVATGTGGGFMVGTGGHLALWNSTMVNNSALLGGGMFVDEDGTASANSSLFWQNRAAADGGAVYFRSADVMFLDVRVVENSAIAGGGGGLFWDWTTVGHFGSLSEAMVHFSANDARYGPDIATHIRQLVGLGFVSAISGTTAPSMNVTAVDWYNQTVVSYDKNFAQVSIEAGAGCGSPQLAGSTVTDFAQGVASFTDVGITCDPSSIVYATFTVVDSDLALEFQTDTKVHLHPCHFGQVVDNDVCLMCGEGKYTWESDWAGETECLDCLDHASCPADNGWKIDVDRGYWRNSNFSTRIRWCPAEESCAGGTNTDNQCEEGSSGPLCQVCETGYYQPSSSAACEKCSSGSRYVPMSIVFALMFVLAAGSVYLFVQHRDMFEHALKRFRESTAIKAGWKVIFAYLQIVSEYQYIFAARFPSSFVAVSSASSVTTLSISTLFAPHCFNSDYSYYDMLISQTVGPVALVVFGMIVCGINMLVFAKDREARRKIRARGFQVFLFFTYIIFPGASTTIFQAFGCDSDFDNSKSYLKSDYSVSCNSQQYRDFVIYAAAMIVVFPLGIIALYCIVLWAYRATICPDVEQIVAGARESIRQLDPEIMDLIGDFHEYQQLLPGVKHNHTVHRTRESAEAVQRKLRFEWRNKNRTVESYTFLYEAYKPEFWWMEVVEAIRRLFMSSVLVLFWPGTASQIVVALAICAFFLIFYSWLQPYMHRLVNQMMISVLWCLFFLLFLTLLIFENVIDDSPVVGVLMLAVLFGGPLLPLILASHAQLRKGTNSDSLTRSTRFDTLASFSMSMKSLRRVVEEEEQEHGAHDVGGDGAYDADTDVDDAEAGAEFVSLKQKANGGTDDDDCVTKNPISDNMGL